MVTKMVTGFESFKRWFSEYSEQYTIIGGTACDLLMSEEGMDFRATRDIDMVLIPANRSFTDLRIRRAGIIPT